LILLNVLLCIVGAVVASDVMLVRPVQPLNAQLLMLVTPLGIIMLAKPEQL
jgi:hypothetical protein